MLLLFSNKRWARYVPHAVLCRATFLPARTNGCWDWLSRSKLRLRQCAATCSPRSTRTGRGRCTATETFQRGLGAPPALGLVQLSGRSATQRSLDTPKARLSSERPHISLVVSEDTWNAVRSHGTGRAGTGSAAALVSALTGHEPVRDIDGIVWPASELATTICDAEVTPMVLDSTGNVLDAGRSIRLFSGHQRRVITTRDGGCGWPGCTMPVRFTELHHIDWWQRDNGSTRIDRGVALCSHHHHVLHRLDLTIERLPRTAPGLGGQRTAVYRILRRDGTVFLDPDDPPPEPLPPSPPSRPSPCEPSARTTPCSDSEVSRRVGVRR